MRIASPLFILSLLAFSATGHHAAAQSAPDATTTKFGERRAYFKDWLAACRPGGYCSALTYVGVSPDGQFADYILRVGQVADGADYEIVFTPVAVLPKSDPALVIKVDGATIATLEPGDDLGLTREPGDALNDLRFAQSTANLDILPEMKRGRFMTVRFRDEDGSANVQTFSLRGLTAALGWFEGGRMR